MKFIIGIGNPGKKYANTRHNVGFWLVDMYAKDLSFRESEKLKAQWAKAQADLLLIKPTTFVNLTGQTVQALAKKYSATAKDFLVVSDDVNLMAGKVRLRPKGSSGGHHGLESIIACLGSDEFPRLRIGVGSKDMPKDLSGFVLGEFKSDEKASIQEALSKSLQVSQKWAQNGFLAAQEELARLQN